MNTCKSIVSVPNMVYGCCRAGANSFQNRNKEKDLIY